jgi:hypothetical protein
MNNDSWIMKTLVVLVGSVNFIDTMPVAAYGAIVLAVCLREIRVRRPLIILTRIQCAVSPMCHYYARMASKICESKCKE